MNDKIALLDLDSISYACFHPNKILDDQGNPLRSEDGKRFIYEDKTPEEIMENTDLIMNTILTNCEATHYIGYIKGFNTISEKLKVNSEYKQDRSKEAPKMWNFTKEYLKLKWGAVEAHNIEVDDILRIANLKLPNSFICCIDGDLLDLEGTHFCWKKKDYPNGLWITTSKEEANYKLWSKMITGGHNNTKGMPGKGEKFVEKAFKALDSDTNYYTVVFNEYLSYYGEFEGIKQFYSNYMCLHTLTDYNEFTMPTIQEFKRVEKKIEDLGF